MAYDDFEDGTINRWTQTTADGGTFVASVAAKKFGSYGGLMTTDGAGDSASITFYNDEATGNKANFYAWIKTTNVNGEMNIMIQIAGGASHIAYFGILNGDFRHYDGAYITTWTTTPADNTWYRMRIDIDNSAGGNVDYYLYDDAGNFLESKLGCTPSGVNDPGRIRLQMADRVGSVQTTYWDNVCYTDTAEPAPPAPSSTTLQTRKYW